jgi:hypothetical protein
MGNTPLLFLVDEGSQSAYDIFVDDYLEHLVNAGADPTVCDVNGATALMKLMRYKDDCTRKYILTTFLRATFALPRTLGAPTPSASLAYTSTSSTAASAPDASHSTSSTSDTASSASHTDTTSCLSSDASSSSVKKRSRKRKSR